MTIDSHSVPSNHRAMQEILGLIRIYLGHILPAHFICICGALSFPLVAKRSLVINGISRFSLASLSALVFALSLVSPPMAQAWELNSENSKSGIFTSAAQFWVDGYGPVTSKQFFGGDFENDIYWASLNIFCQKKTLSVYIYLSQIGSGHDEIKLDDPGYISLTFNGSTTKRYRTYGSGIPATISVKKDAKLLAQAMLTKRTLSTTLRIRYGERIPVKFTISDLAKARTRFKYAGCAF